MGTIDWSGFYFFLPRNYQKKNALACRSQTFDGQGKKQNHVQEAAEKGLDSLEWIQSLMAKW